MAGAARARVTSALEASGCLVAPPVFKTGGRRFASPAGSIPVRLRQLHKRGSWVRWQGGLGRNVLKAEGLARGVHGWGTIVTPEAERPASSK